MQALCWPVLTLCQPWFKSRHFKGWTQHLPTTIMLPGGEWCWETRRPTGSQTRLWWGNILKIVDVWFLYLCQSCLEDKTSLWVPGICHPEKAEGGYFQICAGTEEEKKSSKEDLCQQDHCGERALTRFSITSLWSMNLSSKDATWVWGWWSTCPWPYEAICGWRTCNSGKAEER